MKILKIIALLFIVQCAHAAAPQCTPILRANLSTYLSWQQGDQNALCFSSVENWAATQAYNNTIAISAEIARAIGAETALGNFTQSGTGAVSRTVQSKLTDMVSVIDFGAIPNDGLDDTVALQAAINAAGVNGQTLFVPAGQYMTTATLNITLPINIVGTGAQWVGTPGTVTSSSTNGSVFYIHHAGVGFSFNAPGNHLGYSKVEKFGIIRDQPIPASGWSPNANDFDISVTNTSGFYLDDIFLINPTKGINLQNMGSGKANLNNLRLDAFQIGVQTDLIADTARFNNVHQWNFWELFSANINNVINYKLANLVSWHLSRIDNPMMSNIFSINHNTGILISQSANGTVSKLHGVNIDLDVGTHGLVIDSSCVTDSVTAQFSNLTIQGLGSVASDGITLQSSNAVLQFANTGINSVGSNSIEVTGIVNNSLYFTNTSIIGYDLLATGNPAISATSGNVISFSEKPFILAAGGSGPKYSLNAYGSSAYGTISTPEWQTAYTPVISATSGTLTAATATNFRYMLFGNMVRFNGIFTITNNGTGSGAIEFTLPIAGYQLAQGVGRESSITGKLLSVNISTVNASILNYDNTYPAFTGATLTFSGEYEVNY